MGCGSENCKIILNRIGVWGFRRDSFGSAQFRASVLAKKVSEKSCVKECGKLLEYA
jgi:hypothetical protein